MQLLSGHVEALAVSEGTLVITGLDAKDQQAEIGVVVRGRTADALTLINHPPLHLAADLGIDPAVVGGLVGVRGRFVFPLVKELKLAQLEIAAAAQLQSASVEGVLDRFDVTEGDLLLHVTKTEMNVSGQARLNGVPIGLTWREDFKADHFASTYRLAGWVDDEGRRALQLDAAPYLHGPAMVEAAIDADRGGDFRMHVLADLKDATLTVADLKWEKPAGNALQLDMRLFSTARDAIEFDDIRLSGPGFNLRGALHWRAGKPTKIGIRELRYDNNLLSLSAERQEDEGWRIAVQGAQFDLRPFTTDLFKPEPDPPADPGAKAAAPPVHLDLYFDSLILTDDYVVNTFHASMLRRDDLWQQIDARGRLGAEAPLQWHVWPDGSFRRTVLVSDNAGAVMKALGITDSMIDGKLHVAAAIRDDLPRTPIEGQASISTFKLVQTPLLARLLNIGSFAGIAQLLSGEGISFVRAETPFRIVNGTLSLMEARAWGSAMGFTGSGQVNFATQYINLNGTIVPSYTINSVLGYIPLLGTILTSREGEGLFGATYQISGSLEDPKISVNPLSALAPGILRRMFEPWGEANDAQPKGPPGPSAEPTPPPKSEP